MSIQKWSYTIVGDKNSWRVDLESPSKEGNKKYWYKVLYQQSFKENVEQLKFWVEEYIGDVFDCVAIATDELKERGWLQE